MKNSTRYMAIFFCFIVSTAHSQISHWCATDEMTNAELAANATARTGRQQFNDFVENYVKNNPPSAFRSSGAVQYIIPVVFHIVHQYGPENISDAQIFDEMRNLNRNYQGLRTDTAAVYPTFKPLIADVQIEFRLAQLDPNGNCTNGIDRIASPLTYNGGNNSMINTWPQNQYLNIWTISSFDPSIGGPAAYTFLPGVAPPGKDGIISLHNYVGSIGTSGLTTQYAITHEIAHWFGVPHIWGISNAPGVTCGDDGISDTPITQGFNPCPSPSNAAVCNPPIVENYQNYMDYSYCYYMFTIGQKARMWATLTTPLRNQLYTATNLTATGTDGSVYTCVPTAFFDSRIPKYICEGSSIFLRDLSLNLDSTGNTFTWFSSGASPNSVTGAQVSLAFPTAGIYDVSLTVSNSSGSDTYTATGYVVVTSATASSVAPVVEGFESIALPGTTDWFIDNENVSSNFFETTNVTSFSGSKCVRLQNYSGNVSGTKDAFITPSFSLVNTTASKAFFRVAYANRATGSGDVLKGFVSTDCGASWVQRYIKSASQLTTQPTIAANNFIPPSGSLDTTKWRQDMINLGSFSNQPNVRIKFEFTFDTGNNLYIDDINISGVVGLEDNPLDETDVVLVPNPANDRTKLYFSVVKPCDVKVFVFDLLGQTLQQVNVFGSTTGVHSVLLDSKYARGVYLVQLSAGNQIVNRKLILE